MNQTNKKLFEKSVDLVLNSWTGFQLLIRHNNTGLVFQEKVKWFHEVVSQLFYDNKDLMPYEVEEYLIEILDSEFNSVFEDGSTLEISSLLCKLFELVNGNKVQEVDELLLKLPKCAVDESKLDNQENIENDSEECEELITVNDNTNITETMEIDEAPTNNHQSDPSVNADEGWTVVRGKRK